MTETEFRDAQDRYNDDEPYQESCVACRGENLDRERGRIERLFVLQAVFAGFLILAGLLLLSLVAYHVLRSP